jgi:hypothetical protein
MDWIEIGKWLGGGFLAFIAAGGELHITRKSVRVKMPTRFLRKGE